MKSLKNLFLLTFILILSVSAYGQQAALTNIQKNVNKQAAGLEQLLNFTLDTLTLKSDKNILRVTFLSHDEKDSVIVDIDAPEVKIPLYHFKKGRYTIAVYKEDKMIVLSIKRVEDIARPKNAIADLEESILRSSLSKDEQIARNIKPLNKKPKVTKNPGTRVATAKSRVKKQKPTSKKPGRIRKQRETRVVSKVNKKNLSEIAAEKEKARKAARLKNKKYNIVAEDTTKSKLERQTILAEVKKVPYNLSGHGCDTNEVRQTREEYRQQNSRPNGTPYDD